MLDMVAPLDRSIPLNVSGTMLDMVAPLDTVAPLDRSVFFERERYHVAPLDRSMFDMIAPWIAVFP